MIEHYTSIAKSFDKNWGFTPEYMDWMIKKIISMMKLCENDIFVDVGAGTGLYTKEIDKRIGFRNKIQFVEPSSDMTSAVDDYTNFQVYNMTSDIYLDTCENFNKILFKEVIHHISDRELLWKQLDSKLMNDGKFLIITRPQNTKIPLFKKAKEKFKSNQPDFRVFISEAEKVGFKVDVEIDSFIFKLSKIKWFNMLKDRFMSDLTSFSDKEIQDGILELEKDFLTNEIIVEDEIIFMLGTKVK